jgi:hypothetical protein
MATQKKSCAIRIDLERVEGTREECVKVSVLPVVEDNDPEVWLNSDAILRRWGRTAPATGGYDKCDFAVHFDDGEVYEGRYDLVHPSVEAPSLARHVQRFLRCHALRWIPERYSDAAGRARFAAHVRSVCDPDEIGRFLDSHAIPEVQP